MSPGASLCALGKALAPGLDLIGLHLPQFPGDAIMDDQRRGRREIGRSAEMVAMILGDHDPAHGLIGHGFDLRCDVARVGLVIAGIDKNHALIGHDDHGVGVVALAHIGVDIVRQLDELGLLPGHGESGGRRKQGERDTNGEGP